MYRSILVIVVLSVLLASCNPSPYFQREDSIPQNAWAYNNRLDYKFDITDSTVYYMPYLLLRHTEAYPFRNMWVWMYMKRPGENTFKKIRLNIPMAQADGKWLGRSIGDIIEQRLVIPDAGDSMQIYKKGSYEIMFEQNMRVNPLPELLNIGLRVEKTPVPRRQIGRK
jgi:gliding motility-associated lipoprotein GldH